MVGRNFECSPMGERSRGQPRNRRWDEVLKDIRVLGVRNLTRVVMDSLAWPHLVEKLQDERRRMPTNKELAQHSQNCDQATGWTTKELWLHSWMEQEIFFFTKVSRPVLGLTQPPIQWVAEALCTAVKWLWHKADHSPTSSVTVNNKPSYHCTPPHASMSCL